jgi:hypothetical protein
MALSRRKTALQSAFPRLFKDKEDYMLIDTLASGRIVWKISSKCDSGQCIGVARRGETILITDTSNLRGPVGEFSIGKWRQFIADVKLGDFDEIARGLKA